MYDNRNIEVKCMTRNIEVTCMTTKNIEVKCMTIRIHFTRNKMYFFQRK